MKKIYYKKIIGLFLIVIFVLIGSSCKNDNPFHAKESGDWIYSVDGCSNGQCALLGLSDIGKTKEVIVLPTEIDGLKVTEYGKKRGYIFSPDIILDKCKKIYCNSSVLTVNASFKNAYTSIDVFLPDKYGQLHDVYYSFYDDDKASLYFSFDSYMFGMNKFYSSGAKCYVANIEYYLDDENCFFVDNVESGKIEVIPPTPLRYDNKGYVFEGWYYNDIKWDFENNLVEDYFDGNNHLRLDAKWEELK